MIIKDNFVALHRNICCDPSSEPSQQDGSDEGSQHIVSMRYKNKYPQLSSNTLSYLQLCSLTYFNDHFIAQMYSRKCKTKDLPRYSYTQND